MSRYIFDDFKKKTKGVSENKRKNMLVVLVSIMRLVKASHKMFADWKDTSIKRKDMLDAAKGLTIIILGMFIASFFYAYYAEDSGEELSDRRVGALMLWLMFVVSSIATCALSLKERRLRLVIADSFESFFEKCERLIDGPSVKELNFEIP